MPRRLGITLFVLVLVVAWLASAEVPPPMRLLTVFLLVVLPAMMLVQKGMATEVPEGIGRLSVYLSSAGMLWVLAGITIVAVITSRAPLDGIGLVMPSAAALVGWSAVLTVVGVGWVVGWRLLRVPESALLRFLLPRTTAEKVVFVGVSATAGICEELVFRGFLIPTLEMMLGSVAVATILSSVVFGLLHSYQGTVGIVRTASLGLMLAVPFLLTGSIVPSMVAHAAINVLVGVFLAPWLVGEARGATGRAPLG
jgi:uncharacterized protein